MPAPTVLTIILNYKTADMTLRSAQAARIAMQGLPGEITIVDNDSQDGSFEKIRDHVEAEQWEGIRVLKSGHNGGYGAGNNVGIRAGMSDGTAPDFIYILNSDAFPEPEAITELYNFLQTHPKTGFVGSYIFGEDGDRHTTTFRFPSILSELESAIRFGPITKLLKSYRVPREDIVGTASVDWLAGASMMMRRSVLDEIGLFDETFFLYFEEADLCARARSSNYSIHYVYESRVMHLGSVSTGMKTWDRVPDYWFESRFHYFQKNYGLTYAGFATLVHLSAGSLHWLRCRLTGKTRDVSPNFLRSMAKHDFANIIGSITGTTHNQSPELDTKIGE
ncbi:GT2 family glycosyltransferase [Litoreibacter halocynthiae]|uniref:GT2 family glycosyltransferase n=1 Tax=Litoreibacter halocynthiae TaxID=1242689 RepID=A0A4V3EWN4_9RHOB|nr:glycosyltransferase family 2 protein [Litoreibacter halocynthiae]TDT73125.1 GT2 family glycosyltransferase [Litoreibacter halocynthiae]